MISAEQQKQIAKILKIDETKFSDAIKATEEVAVEIPEGLTAVTDKDLQHLKNTEYNNGKEAGVEMAVKDTKTKLNLEFTGKTVENLVEAAQKKAVEDAKIPVDKKVVELQGDIEKLRTENATLATEKAAKEGIASAALADREIYRQVPTLGENAIGIDPVVKLMRGDGYDFVKEGNDWVGKLNGETIKDNLAKPIAIKDIVSGYAKDNKLINEAAALPAGRGGGDGKTDPVFTKMSEVKKHFVDQGKSLNGDEFMTTVTTLKEKNADFDMAG